jgi:hypothetical protein
MIVERYRLLWLVALLGFWQRQNILNDSLVHCYGVVIENYICGLNRNNPSGGDERIDFCPIIHENISIKKQKALYFNRALK